jgi:hypothetical protein
LALALVISVSVPLTVPAEAGSNVTLNFWLCPGEMETGAVRPERANPFPDTWTWLTVMLVVLVLLAVTLCVPFAPTAAFTETLLGVMASCDALPGGVEGGDDVVLRAIPPQPEVNTAAPNTADANNRNRPRFSPRKNIDVSFFLDPTRVIYERSESRPTYLAGDGLLGSGNASGRR